MAEQESSVNKADVLDVLDDLNGLHATLKQAEAQRDDVAVVVARYDIDCALERLLSVASVDEFGAGGTAPT